MEQKEVGESKEIIEDKTSYSCEHYQRNCQLVSPCCDQAFTCRICHDLEKYESEQDPKLRHKLDRFQVKEVVCSSCNLKQPVSQNCINCQICFGTYFCNICNLFDNVDKGQFHCLSCGFCRIGGQDNFIHCENCNMCINKNVYEGHKCIKVKESVCPICMDDLYTSINKILPLICGHYIHLDCLNEYLKTNYKCPVCSVTIVNTELLNQYLDFEVANTEMPPEYSSIQLNILCNDCHKESNVNFHIVALKCLNCGSFNTRKI
ncbi:MAG: zinc-finger and zinc-ribbon domain protein [Barrevirus sp.]|uniref:Zinc-finger and zinc-ribbon domain protein n=1 Tax=Barrevirus sp. TaxID=2487763 RepID=A0A3G4ZTZ7_9VIRU|nr:MAG: zinc-finger and zinc-ribbon domain protein [Barrevirus sp.]